MEPTPTNLIIGLSGKARSGKDTAAMLLREYFPDIHFTGFSLPLKEAFDKEFGTNTRWDEDEKDRYRKELNDWSMAILDKDPLHWVRMALSQDPPLLFKDVRMLPEADGIREKGGILIRVNVSFETMRQRWGEFYGEGHTAHKTENLLDDYPNWDFIIENDGTLEELREQVEEIANVIRARLAGN